MWSQLCALIQASVFLMTPKTTVVVKQKPVVQDTTTAQQKLQVQDTAFAASSQQPTLLTSCIDAIDATAKENEPNPYFKKEENCSDKWEKMHQELLVVHTELCAIPDQSQCICCGFNLPTIRCLDCGSHALFCEEDFVERHKNAAFHSPEICNVTHSCLLLTSAHVRVTPSHYYAIAFGLLPQKSHLWHSNWKSWSGCMD